MLASLVLALVTFSVDATVLEKRVEWRIENAYPFFMHVEDWERLKPKDEESFSSWSSRLQEGAESLTAKGESLWPSSDRTQWEEGDSRQRNGRKKGFRPDYLSSEVRVFARVEGGDPATDCRWPDAGVTLPCNKEVAFSVPPESDNTIAVELPDGRKLVIKVRVDRKIVLALGDSFSSGEGNPDKPQQFCRRTKDSESCVPYELRGKGADWFPKAVSRGIEKADWLDDQCNRSLYSYQNLVAMWHASRNYHQATYFLPLACSGAEIGDGLLRDQSYPPGGTRPRTHAQLDAAESVLGCRAGACKYYPNLILLSIGGNDAYFASLLTAILTPKVGRSVLGSMGMSVIRNASDMDEVAGNANHRLTDPHEIPQEIDEMLRRFKRSVAAQRPKLVVTGYPNLLRREDESWCSVGCEPGVEYSGNDWRRPDFVKNPDLQCRSSINHALNHVNFLPFFLSPRDWEFRVTGEPSDPALELEQEVLDKSVISILNGSLKQAYLKSSAINSFDFVWVNPPPATDSHGVCAVDNRVNQRAELDWPWAREDGTWLVQSPFQWNAYEKRARWFRTPNDVYRTQVSTVSPPQGAYHPTAEYHSALAEEIVIALEGPTTPSR
ncbi:MAG: hypothetical protein GXC75_17135 [Xanthomonadaceae bacterium]|nr:hypothetical protein [Xanthomonadaceae bacterium]